MFLHLGDDFSVRIDEVISVHDFQCLSDLEIGREFLTREKDNIEDVSGGKPKSVVVTNHKIYLSKLSPGTLKKRAGDIGFGMSL